ncbi:amino acid transporter [Rubellimicrobium roseum]|uniref:Amino acid transporter n=1 Tax=Rubellimicrobium roseum TaxID=687525 RepID=A0A5C4NC23_9RHOB|nr:amino acid transporter [Rubellimicrobium roseum]
MAACVTGFLTGLSLILAIGAQNAFVLRQGLLRAHVLPLCLLCALSDAVLIAAGVLGFGALTQALPGLPRVMALGGAAFLLVYGAQRLWAAWKGDYGLVLSGRSAPLGATLAMGAAFTWLNPHVYLDTLGLVGAVSTQFEGSHRLAFGLGATTASFVFFFSLGYGARLLAPVMTSAASWRVLDTAIAAVMWTLAAGLVLSA